MTARKELTPLNLPAVELVIRSDESGRTVFDPVRRRHVRLSPEEWVRQHFLHYLIQQCAYPSSLIAVEMGFRFQSMPRRADIVVHDRGGAPFLMVECKAPDAGVGQSTFDQVSHYNRVVSARYLAATNGLLHYCWQIDRSTGAYEFLNGVPPFPAES
jgi:hypothetical protein